MSNFINAKTERLKLLFPTGNYFFDMPVTTIPHINDFGQKIQQKTIPPRDAFLILNVVSESSTYGVYFEILWNNNKHIIYIFLDTVNKMYFLTENGPINMEILL